MGLNIGQTSIAISSLYTPGANRPNRLGSSDGSGAEGARLVKPEEVAPARAGFGEDTLSPLGAALTTLDSNLAAAEELVPTVAELRERSRAIQAERAADAPTRRPVERSDTLRRLETTRPEPDPAVRNFVSEPEPVTLGQQGDAEATDSETPEPASFQAPPASRLDIQA